jgi:hypothetical protein
VRSALGLRNGDMDFSAFEGALSGFVALAREYGFIPIVAYSPSAYTAYADFVEFEDASLGELMPWFSRTQRQFLRTKARELGYRFVDLTPAMQAAANDLQEKELIYHPINVHFTVKGNRIVGETLADAISTQQSGSPAIVK